MSDHINIVVLGLVIAISGLLCEFGIGQGRAYLEFAPTDVNIGCLGPHWYEAGTRLPCPPMSNIAAYSNDACFGAIIINER
jgi:hypothetical protein